MKCIIITALVFACLARGLHAQGLRLEQMTLGMVNCRWWVGQPSDTRLGFVMGYLTAVRVIADISTDKRLAEMTSTAATHGEIVRGVGKLCAARENGPLPISTMISAFAAKSRGASDAQIAAALQEGRKNAAMATSVEGQKR